jgi:hypothetical protein
MTTTLNPATREIARTILDQIGTNTIMCLGVPRNTICVIPETTEHLGGVQFKFTNCPKVRTGTVRVLLMPNDTYNVEVLNIRGRKIAEFSNVYCEMLGGQSGVIEGVTG